MSLRCQHRPDCDSPDPFATLDVISPDREPSLRCARCGAPYRHVPPGGWDPHDDDPGERAAA